MDSSIVTTAVLEVSFFKICIIYTSSDSKVDTIRPRLEIFRNDRTVVKIELFIVKRF